MAIVWQSGTVSLDGGETGTYGFTTTSSKPHHIIIEPVLSIGQFARIESEEIRGGIANKGYFKLVRNMNPTGFPGVGTFLFKVVAVRED